MIDKILADIPDCLKAFKNFSLECKSLGVFRNPNNPKALWLGFKESKELLELKMIINKFMKGLGFDFEEKVFVPHLTIGRTKQIKNKDVLKNLLNKYRDFEIQSFEVKCVVFYESVLTPKGAIYKEIERFNFS